MLDGHDNILSHPDKSLILEKFKDIDGSAAWRDESHGFMRAPDGWKLMFESRKLSRKDTRVGQPWTVVGVVPAEEILLVLRRQQDLQLNVGLIAILVTLLLGIRSSRMFAQPIADAAGAARKVQESSLDVRIQESGTNKIRDLAHAFNEMAAELDTHRNHVKSLVHTQTEKLRRTEVSLRAYAGDQERSNHELQSFAYVASHDLQEPLREVITFGDRLQAGYKTQLDDRGVNYLSPLQNASRRMQTLIEDLLAYSRLATSVNALAEVNFDPLIRDLVSDLEIPISEFGAKVVVENLPVIEADALQMRQLFKNLLSNALEFRREGITPVIRIAGHVRETKESESLQALTIEDNGAGFDLPYADRISDVFQRRHSHSEYAGTGIGLAICRKIVVRHGGSIQATSSLGNGTRFTVTLPARHPLPPDEAGASLATLFP